MVPLKDELKAALISPSPVIAWISLSGLVSYSGPFGTYDGLPLAQRMIYWASVIALAVISGVTLRVIVRRWMPGRGAWQISVVTAALMGLLLAWPVAVFTEFMSVGIHGRVPPAPEMAFLIFVVALASSALRSLMTEDPAPPLAARPRLLDRVEPGLRGRIFRAAAFDHYVSLVTEKGEARLLMRFSDAMAELDGIEGLQVHRSHWVAAEAVVGHAIEKGRMFLRLEDGSAVPVSRNFRAEVERRLLRQAKAIGIGRATAPVRTASAPGSISPESARSSQRKPPV